MPERELEQALPRLHGMPERELEQALPRPHDMPERELEQALPRLHGSRGAHPFWGPNPGTVDGWLGTSVDGTFEDDRGG